VTTGPSPQGPASKKIVKGLVGGGEKGLLSRHASEKIRVVGTPTVVVGAVQENRPDLKGAERPRKPPKAH